MITVLQSVITRLRGTIGGPDPEPSDETEHRLVETAENVFSAESGVTLDARKEEISGWDSLGNLNLLLALEEEFDVEFDEEELQNADSLAYLSNTLKRKVDDHHDE